MEDVVSMRNSKSVEHAAWNSPAVLRPIAAALARSTSSCSWSFRSFAASTDLAGAATGLTARLLAYGGGGAVSTDEDEAGIPRALDNERRSISSAGGLTSFRNVEGDTDADDAGDGTLPESEEHSISSAVDRTWSREVVERDTDADDGHDESLSDREERSISSALERTVSRDVFERDTDAADPGYAILEFNCCGAIIILMSLQKTALYADYWPEELSECQ